MRAARAAMELGRLRHRVLFPRDEKRHARVQQGWREPTKCCHVVLATPVRGRAAQEAAALEVGQPHIGDYCGTLGLLCASFRPNPKPRCGLATRTIEQIKNTLWGVAGPLAVTKSEHYRKQAVMGNAYQPPCPGKSIREEPAQKLQRGKT